MFIRDKEHTVVNTVREARTALKITQDELAEKVQATRQTIIAIEKGNYVPSVLLALRIVAILDKKVEEIFQYEQMLILAAVLGLIATFLVLFWREQPDDEREMQNQALASRSAYTVGSLVLITALIIQSIDHNLDPAIPIALLAMIATKVIVQRTKDGE